MILLRKARIYDSKSRFHLKRKDILIEKGVILKISGNIKPKGKIKIIESADLCISPGWLDIGCFNGEPGFEYREDLNSLRDAAAAGGYCRIAPFPTGNPTIDNKGQLHYLKSRINDHLVEILPIAALSKNRKGIEIAELMDLNDSGAIAFTDGNDSSMTQDQLQRSLLYLKSFGGLAIYNANEISVNSINEGKVSVSMGLSGDPAHEEENNIRQALTECEYAESPILIHNISTSSCLKDVKNFSIKEQIRFSVPFMNLIFDEEDVLNFNLNLKVDPPLRDKRERKALCKALETGQINSLTSNHTPLSIEEKDQPFGLSTSGAATIEHVFPAMNTMCKDVSLEKLIFGLSEGPHEALGIACNRIAEGRTACLTVFDPSISNVPNESQLKSKSTNSPFLDKELTGRVLGIINRNKSTV